MTERSAFPRIGPEAIGTVMRSVILSALFAIAGCGVQFEHALTEVLPPVREESLEGAWAVTTDEDGENVGVLHVARSGDGTFRALYVEAKKHGEFDLTALEFTPTEIKGTRYMVARLLRLPDTGKSKPLTEYLVVKYIAADDRVKVWSLAHDSFRDFVLQQKLGGTYKGDTVGAEVRITDSAATLVEFFKTAPQNRLFDHSFTLRRLRPDEDSVPR